MGLAGDGEQGGDGGCPGPAGGGKWGLSSNERANQGLFGTGRMMGIGRYWEGLGADWDLGDNGDCPVQGGWG